MDPGSGRYTILEDILVPMLLNSLYFFLLTTGKLCNQGWMCDATQFSFQEAWAFLNSGAQTYSDYEGSMEGLVGDHPVTVFRSIQIRFRKTPPSIPHALNPIDPKP